MIHPVYFTQTLDPDHSQDQTETVKGVRLDGRVEVTNEFKVTETRNLPVGTGRGV